MNAQTAWRRCEDCDVRWKGWPGDPCFCCGECGKGGEWISIPPSSPTFEDGAA